MFAGAAVIAFVLAEVGSSAGSASVAPEEMSGMTPEFEAAEF
jgi:hypothetical protein